MKVYAIETFFGGYDGQLGFSFNKKVAERVLKKYQERGFDAWIEEYEYENEYCDF